MLLYYVGFQGKSNCYIASRPITPVGLLAHETAAENPDLKRYVDAPECHGRNRAGNTWNRPLLNPKMVHGFVGRNIDNVYAFHQTIPLDIAAYGCGGGRFGSYNYNPTKTKPRQHARLQVEQCRPYTEADYWKEVEVYTSVFALWARQFGWNPNEFVDDAQRLTSHRQAARLGFASNHGDPESLMAKYGDSMDKFRQRVAAKLLEPPEEVKYIYCHAMPTYKWKPTKRYAGVKLLQECLNTLGYHVSVDWVFGDETHAAVRAFRESWGIQTPVDKHGNPKAVECDAATWAAINRALNGEKYVPIDPNNYTGTVRTSTGNGIGLYASATSKTNRVATLREGVTVRITGPIASGYMAPAAYSGAVGYCDTRYIANKK